MKSIRCSTAVVAAIALVVAPAAPAAAQSRVVVTPSVSVGWVYDDNLFYQTSAEAERILRFTSGLDLRRETQRTTLDLDVSFDLERFDEHRTLSTPLARQVAFLRTRTQAAPRVVFEFEGGFESTRAPSELNLSTGILTGRRRAYRLHGGPGVVVDVTPTARISADYELYADIVPGGTLLVAGQPDAALESLEPASRLYTHVAGAQFAQGITPRNELRLDYVARWFVIGDERRAGVVAPLLTPGQTIGTHTALVGWAFRVNPAVRFEAAVGPRLRQGSFGIDGIEAQALLWRQRPSHDVFASYARTVTTAIGLRSLIEVDRALLRGVYRPPFGIQTEGEVGFYQNTVDEQTVRAFQLSGGITVPIAGPLAIGASYSVDFQRGRFGGALLQPIVPGPGPILDPNAPLRRTVAMVRVILAPQVRRTPEDPPPGATPSRTTEIKRSDR
jgi:hypothetical protein